VEGLTVRVVNQPVDADTELMVDVTSDLESGSWLQDVSLTLLDGDDREVECFEDTVPDTRRAARRRLVCRAPITAGSQSWVVVAADGAGGVPGLHHQNAVRVPFTFFVRPHSSRILTWGVPAIVGAGVRAPVQVGLKCSSSCNLGGEEVVIKDAHGAEVARARLHSEPTAGTTGLYATVLELTAPPKIGEYSYVVEYLGSAGGVPHERASRPFTVRTGPPADCDVTVEVFDQASRVPVAGASVHLHPYVGVTGEDGRVTVPMPRGEYAVYVAKVNYATYRGLLEAEDGVQVSVGLVAEAAPTVDDLY
jgi:hypothetical protein